MKCWRTVRGFGFGSGMDYVAEPNLRHSGWAKLKARTYESSLVRKQTGDGGGTIAVAHEPQTHQAPRSAGLQIASLGLLVVPGNDDKGAEVTEIAPNSVAAMTGLHAGDIINSLNGTQVRTPMELATMLSGVPAGSKTEIGYLVRGMWQSQTILIMPNN